MAIQKAQDWEIAVPIMCHDVVASHEAIRSWGRYSIADYLALYPRTQMLFIAYPSPEMVSDSQHTFSLNLEGPVNYALIQSYGDAKKNGRPQPKR